MGSRLALLAVVQLSAAALLGGDALADSRARELYKRGIEEYKAQQYEDAVATLKESYELEPRPDALFALAQAERLGGRCTEARVHYKKLLDSTSDPATTKAVQSNLDLCGPEPDKPARPAEPEKRPVGTPGAPQKPRTVVREVRHADKLATLLLAGGMLGVGAGGGLFLAAKNSREDADRAATLDDHVRLSDRSNTLRVASYAAAGAGVLMTAVAVVRWAVGGDDKTETAQMTLAPSSSGAMLVLSAGW
jgi:tetratricopeptide (TPR) repeat protein